MQYGLATMTEQVARLNPRQKADMQEGEGTDQEDGPNVEPRSKFRALTPAHMPKDFSISLDAYRRGGTDAFLGKSPDHLARHSLSGFEPTYVNIVDYIIRITHQIWEEKDIGYIYDSYSHDCMVWGDLGLQAGRDLVVAHTTEQINAFPDIRILADEMIWAGDDQVGFHTSHRSQILGTNTGYTAYGPPTGKRIQFMCMANCVARDNEIFYEHVVYRRGLPVEATGFRCPGNCAQGGSRRRRQPAGGFPRQRADAHGRPGQAAAHRHPSGDRG